MTVHRHTQQNRQHMYTHNIEVHLHNNCCQGKATSIQYSECVPVNRVMQHAKHKHCIILSFVTCLALKLSHKWHDFWKKALKKKFFYFIYKLSETVLTVRRFEQDIIKNCTNIFMSSIMKLKFFLTFLKDFH